MSVLQAEENDKQFEWSNHGAVSDFFRDIPKKVDAITVVNDTDADGDDYQFLRIVCWVKHQSIYKTYQEVGTFQLISRHQALQIMEAKPGTKVVVSQFGVYRKDVDLSNKRVSMMILQQ